MHFGWRGIDEHRHVCYGDFEFGFDDHGANKINDQIWYKNQPVGVNSLSKYMKLMSDGTMVLVLIKKQTIIYCKKNYDYQINAK